MTTKEQLKIFEEKFPNITDNARNFWKNEIEKASEEGIDSIEGITDLEEEIIEKLAFKKKYPEELRVYVNSENGKKTLKYRGVILATRKNSPAYREGVNYNLIDEWVDEGKNSSLFNPLKTDEENWRNISSNFTEELISQWKDNGFTYQQVEERTKIGLTVEDADFASWLLTTKQVVNRDDLPELRKSYEEAETVQFLTNDCFSSTQKLKIKNALKIRRISESILNNLPENNSSVFSPISVADGNEFPFPKISPSTDSYASKDALHKSLMDKTSKKTDEIAGEFGKLEFGILEKIGDSPLSPLTSSVLGTSPLAGDLFSIAKIEEKIKKNEGHPRRNTNFSADDESKKYSDEDLNRKLEGFIKEFEEFKKLSAAEKKEKLTLDFSKVKGAALELQSAHPSPTKEGYFIASPLSSVRSSPTKEEFYISPQQQRKIAELEEQINNLERTAISLVENNENQALEIKELKTKNENLIQETLIKENYITEVEADNEKKLEEIDKLGNIKKEQNQKISNLSGELKANKATIEQIISQRDQLISKNEQAEKPKKELAKKIEELTVTLSNSMPEQNSIEKENAGLKSKITEQQQQIEKHEKTIEDQGEELLFKQNNVQGLSDKEIVEKFNSDLGLKIKRNSSFEEVIRYIGRLIRPINKSKKAPSVRSLLSPPPQINFSSASSVRGEGSIFTSFSNGEFGGVSTAITIPSLIYEEDQFSDCETEQFPPEEQLKELQTFYGGKIEELEAKLFSLEAENKRITEGGKASSGKDQPTQVDNYQDIKKEGDGGLQEQLKEAEETIDMYEEECQKLKQKNSESSKEVRRFTEFYNRLIKSHENSKMEAKIMVPGK